MATKMFTLGDAARATGLSKTTISKALKSGKLSYRSKTSAGYEIDPAELMRVYPLTAPQPATVDDPHPQEERVTVTPEPGDEALRAEVKMLREMVEMMKADRAELKEDRDEWRTQAQRLAISQEKAEPMQRGWFGLRRRAR